MLKNIFKNLKKKFFPSGKKGNFKEAIEDLIEEQEIIDDKLDDGTKKIFSNVIDIRNKCIEDIMIPRADIVAISENLSLDELMITISKSKHSRIPTFSENLDKITGMVHIRDFLSSIRGIETKQIRKKTVKEISRKILFSSPSMKILDLLLKMRSNKIHMAVVVDEFGGTDGLVTIEDLVEEIVGEIEDEHDMVQPLFFRKITGKSFEVSARMLIEDFEKKTKKSFKDDDIEKIDTLGGLVFSISERVPERGEIINYPKNNVEFKIIEADTRKIKKLIVTFK